jgi:hypothetical protein
VSQVVLFKVKQNVNKKFSQNNRRERCPYKRRCFSDSGVCGSIGYYAECPQTLEDKILTEIREGVYEGVTPRNLFRAVRKNE